MVDYNAVVSDLGKGIKDLGVTVYDVTGTALTGTGNSLYHLSLRKVDLRDIFSSNVTRWIAIGAMALITYSSCSGSCAGNPKHKYVENHNESAKVQVLEKKVNDLE